MIRLKELRKSHHLSQKDIADECGVTVSAVSLWESGKNKMDYRFVIQLAKLFDVTPEYFEGKSNTAVALEKTGVKIPVLGYIRAGIPIAAIEDILDWEEISESLAKRGEYVGLRVRGNSMSPEIKDGDVAIIRRQEEVEDGEIAAVIINGDEATLKKIKKTDQGIILIGLNVAEYEPHPYSFEQIESLPVRIYGKLIEVRRKYG